jgi:hypothetical protein
MVDKLIEDLVEVTETLMGAEGIDIEAFAHPNAKPTLNERLSGEERWGGWGKWGKKKADDFRAKMLEQKASQGVFKRGVC